MRNAWDWLRYRLPFVMHTWRGQWEAERNPFELGRDYERGQQREAAQR